MDLSFVEVGPDDLLAVVVGGGLVVVDVGGLVVVDVGGVVVVGGGLRGGVFVGDEGEHFGEGQ